jgi:hypothetical protein
MYYSPRSSLYLSSMLKCQNLYDWSWNKSPENSFSFPGGYLLQSVWFAETRLSGQEPATDLARARKWRGNVTIQESEVAVVSLRIRQVWDRQGQ